MARAISSRYARALADAVTAPGAGVEPQRAARELREFTFLLAISVPLRNVLLSPAVAGARKRGVVARLGESLGLSRLVRNFLFVVVDRRRVEQLSEFCDAFEALLDERLGLARAEVRSALELSDAQRRLLEAQLARLTGKQVRGEFKVEPELLGGAVARVGSTIYDGSVRGQLEALRRRMTAE